MSEGIVVGGYECVGMEQAGVVGVTLGARVGVSERGCESVSGSGCDCECECLWV